MRANENGIVLPNSDVVRTTINSPIFLFGELPRSDLEVAADLLEEAGFGHVSLILRSLKVNVVEDLSEGWCKRSSHTYHHFYQNRDAKYAVCKARRNPEGPPFLSASSVDDRFKCPHCLTLLGLPHPEGGSFYMPF